MVRTRILVVDDEPRIVELLVECLEHSGFEVLGAESTQEAMLLLRSWQPDVVVSDVRMPGGGAATLLQSIAETARQPTFVLMTGSEFDTADDLVRTGDAIAVLAKPFLVSDLVDLIHAAGAHREYCGSDISAESGESVARRRGRRDYA